MNGMNIDTAIILLDNLARHELDITAPEFDAIGMGVKALQKMKELDVVL